MNKVKLNPSQIEDIVQTLPRCLAATQKVADKMREQIQNKLRKSLKNVEIVDKPEAFDRLKQLIEMQHFNSLVSPGEPVGLRAAEAIAQPVTQSVLNAFHSAGSSASVSSGINTSLEIFRVSKNRKNENTNIHFKNKNLIYEDIIDLRREMVGITIQDLMIANRTRTEFLMYNPENVPYWYNSFLEIYREKLPFDTNSYDYENPVNFMRIKFDTLKLFSYNITLTHIANKLRGDENIIVCIPSPTKEGIIDVFVNTQMLNASMLAAGSRTCNVSPDSADPGVLFLQLCVIPQLKEIIVNGVQGITQIFPKDPGITEIILVNDSEKIGKNKYRIYLDKINIKTKGLPVVKLIDLLRLVGVKILEMNEDYFDLEDPRFETKTPTVLLNGIIDEEKEKVKNKIKELKASGVMYPDRKKLVTDILRAGVYVYAQTNGTNFNKVLAHPLVDPKVTMCINPHEILKNLGIEAARNFLINSYLEIGGGSVSPRHTTIVADFQTNRGTLIPITSKGASKHNIGPLSLASFEDPMVVFTNAAAFGKIEEIKSASSSIFVGKRMILGTGSFNARIDAEALNEAERIRNEDRLNNPDKYIGYTNDEYMAIASEMKQDDTKITHNDDSENSFGIIGIEESLDVYNQEIFKTKNPIPDIQRINDSLPIFIVNIINTDTMNQMNQGKTFSPVVTKTNIQLPVEVSISKPGLPMLAKLNATQIVAQAAELPVQAPADEFDLDLDF